jgi:hypothetical protein
MIQPPRSHSMASGLRTTAGDPVEYFHAQFVTDLDTVIGDRPEMGPARLSVASFCPDYPQADSFSGPARRFAQLDDQSNFLVSFFVTQLVSQASYSRKLPFYVGTPTVLVGLLGSYNSVMHPGFLLLVLALFREAVEAVDTTQGIVAVLRNHICTARPKLVSDWQSINEAMCDAMTEEQTPRSLSPFVPNGDSYHFSPDLQTIDVWRNAVAETLREAGR